MAESTTTTTTTSASADSGRGARFARLEDFADSAQLVISSIPKIKTWDELGLDTVYKLTSIQTYNGRFGLCYLSDITTEAGERTKTWLPTSMVTSVRDNRRFGESAYFISLGCTTSANSFSKLKRNNYSLLFLVDESANENLILPVLDSCEDKNASE